MSGLAILGIDPGLGGGLALLHPEHGINLEIMPKLGAELNAWTLNEIIAEYAGDIRLAVIERVHSMPKQGVASSFKFGFVTGVVHGLLAANKIRTVTVTPQEWMKVMHQGVPGKLSTKDRGRMAFKRIFPDVSATATERSKVMHDGLVDAALMAEYGLRKVNQGIWT